MTFQTSQKTASTTVILMPIFIAKTGHGSDLERALLTLQTASRGDRGCLEYSVFSDLNDENRFVMHEEWTDQELLAAHNREAHVREFLAQAEELLSEPFAVTWMRPHRPLGRARLTLEAGFNSRARQPWRRCSQQKGHIRSP